MCPCDSPFLEQGLVEALLNACIDANAEIGVAHDGERLQPVFCAVKKQTLPSLNEFLNSGERKIDKWFSHHNIQIVDAAGFATSFVNINTEDDLKKAENQVLR